jgi:hypothetical protein
MDALALYIEQVLRQLLAHDLLCRGGGHAGWSVADTHTIPFSANVRSWPLHCIVSAFVRPDKHGHACPAQQLRTRFL